MAVNGPRPKTRAIRIIADMWYDAAGRQYTITNEARRELLDILVNDLDGRETKEVRPPQRPAKKARPVVASAKSAKRKG